MTTSLECPWLEVEPHGDTLDVKVTCRDILDEEATHALSTTLFRLAEEGGGRRLVLDLGAVRCMESGMVAKLVKLHRNCKAEGGGLVLSCLQPSLLEVFQTLQLTRFLNIHRPESGT
ncbi:MAG: STAS domain-containing protein [Planctomycetes bacterium]|nr:STAS domain-containing protein [Planctomycetota bacterium]